MNKHVQAFLDKLDNPPEEISQLLKDNQWVISGKGYGTPELEIKYLHQLFLYIQSSHPQFETFSWEQYNGYYDNYSDFQLIPFTVNNMHTVESGIEFYAEDKHYTFSESNGNSVDRATEYNTEGRADEYLPSAIDFHPNCCPDPDAVEYARINNYYFDGEMLATAHWKEYERYRKNKYAYLEAPCLKFLAVLKLLEIKYGMYYFLYTFGNGAEVKFSSDGVTVRKLEPDETFGSQLGEGMVFDN